MALRLPIDAKRLIEQLNQQYPHRCPMPHMSEREIWMYAGARAVVDALITQATDSKVAIDLNAELPD